MLDILASAASSSHVISWESLGIQNGIHLGFFTLRFYSLAYLAGIALGYWHLSKMIKGPGAPMAQRHVDDLFFYCTLGIIIGGRLGYATFYDPSMFYTFAPHTFVSWRLLRLWDGGMSFHGGVIGVLIAIAWVSWRGKLSFIRVCDYIAVNVGFGMMFGRIANFINGELWGRPAPSWVPFRMTFCDIQHTANTCISSHIPRYPSELYEAALEGGMVILVMLPLFWKTRARFRPALLTGVFTATISIARFIVEYFREPDPQLLKFAEQTGLSMGQWLSIPLIIGGILLIVWSLSRPSLASVAPPAGDPDADSAAPGS